jgi:hypothetical protein
MARDVLVWCLLSKHAGDCSLKSNINSLLTDTIECGTIPKQLLFTTEEENKTMMRNPYTTPRTYVRDYVARIIVIVIALLLIAVAVNLVSGTSNASSCHSYKTGGSYLRTANHTYAYIDGTSTKVSKNDIIVHGTCPSNGIVNQTTQKSTPTVTTQQGKDIDKDKKEDKEHSKKSHHVTEKAPVINQTINNTTNQTVYNSYTTYAASNQTTNELEIDSSYMPIDSSVMVGLYEMQRYSTYYCLGGHCVNSAYCDVLIVHVNSDQLICIIR